MEKPCVLACVTGQRSCERYIRAGAELSEAVGGTLSVVHVAARGARFMGDDDEGAVLEHLFQISKQHDADMMVFKADDVVDGLATYSQNKGVTHIVIGAARAGRDVARELQRRLPNVAFTVLTGAEAGN